MKNQLIYRRKFSFVLIAGFALMFLTRIAAQDGAQMRSIDAEDFLKNRPADAAGTLTPPKNKAEKAQPPKPKQRVKYQPVGKEQNVVRLKNKTPRAKSKPTEPATTAEIGVTMWRLRPSQAADTGPKIRVKLDYGKYAMWTPVRVNTNAVFKKGDKVRFAIESSKSGYLYVVNSEIYSNGTIGAPFLIFPASTDENNRVRPGLLVDFPDQNETTSYFNINPKRPNYAGELLTVIVSPEPLDNMQTDGEGRILNIESLAEMEENIEAESYARVGGDGEIYTEAEKKAVCDQKTRQLEREKKEPCVKTRQLTREAPPPQNIYRAKSYGGKPTVMFFSLNVATK